MKKCTSCTHGVCYMHFYKGSWDIYRQLRMYAEVNNDSYVLSGRILLKHLINVCRQPEINTYATRIV